MILLFLTMVAGTGITQVLSEHYLKGMFLYNFARFVEWSDAGRQQDSFDVCAVASSEVVQDLRSALTGKYLGDSAIVVRRVRDLQSSKRCRIVFMDGEAVSSGKDLRTAESGVLTVGESEDFLKKGGMIRFVNVNGKLSFEVSDAMARRGGVKLSSRLLSVARRVEY